MVGSAFSFDLIYICIGVLTSSYLSISFRSIPLNLISYPGSHFHFDLYHGHAQSAFRFYIFSDGLTLIWKNCYLELDNRRWTSTFLQHPQAGLQLPLRVVFPPSNCKIRKGKKKEIPGRKKKKIARRSESRNNSTATEGDLSDLALPYSESYLQYSTTFGHLHQRKGHTKPGTSSSHRASVHVCRPVPI